MPTDRASYEIDYDKSAVPYASVQSAPFKLKSGNTSSFKLMGSSPAKIDFGGIGGGSLWDRIKTQMREARQKRAAARGVDLGGRRAVAPGGGSGAHTHGTGGEPIGGTQAGIAEAAAPEMPVEPADEEMIA